MKYLCKFLLSLLLVLCLILSSCSLDLPAPMPQESAQSITLVTQPSTTEPPVKKLAQVQEVLRDHGGEAFSYIPKGEIFPVIARDGDALLVEHRGVLGWIRSDSILPTESPE